MGLPIKHLDLPFEYLREYDAACEHFARTGKLPMCMGSPGALDYINAAPEAFLMRVQACRYADAMAKWPERD